MGKGKKKSDGPLKKRRSPSDFQSSRLAFLLSRIPAYILAFKSKKTRQFWVELLHEYWRMFPWRLALNEEPPAGELVDPKTAEEAFKALDLDLSEEDEARKSKNNERH
ncbi:hypothetical protein C8R43DRAFT_1123036 [Mycena crocata]|nr:hypothetical protein C8R43DRAFT_1123036 [Mycena crocata]